MRNTLLVIAGLIIAAGGVALVVKTERPDATPYARGGGPPRPAEQTNVCTTPDGAQYSCSR